jgi:2-keto-3-deoxy-L-arabinonate dehydratase
MSTSSLRFTGIWPMLYAFFNAEGALDRAAMRLQAEAVVAGGAQGLAVLGLATEVSKLTPAERRMVVEWAAEDLAGRLPLAVTIFGATPEAQGEALDHAAACGAALGILQPPREPRMDEAALAAFFARVMARAPIPVGIQNAPEFLGVGLSPAAIAALARAQPNFVVLKGEGPATLIAEAVAATEGRLAVFNGRGGLELPDNFRAGCQGIIPAPDCFEAQVAIHAAMLRGDVEAAEQLYAEILPAIVFVMQGIDHLVCYGKRLVAARLGLGRVHDRPPGLAPTAFGEQAVARFAARLGPMPVHSGARSGLSAP